MVKQKQGFITLPNIYAFLYFSANNQQGIKVLLVYDEEFKMFLQKAN
ncbi:hypothetical protein Syn7502_02226 [Synechococcus sp. PCC 7502]|nr:hypothetical protein Syn7502_02226 [Synechococcus sp. PCC 7502]